MATALELLDRQCERLQERDGAEFIHELRRFHELITTGPSDLVTALTELRVGAEGIESEFQAHDKALASPAGLRR